MPKRYGRERRLAFKQRRKAHRLMEQGKDKAQPGESFVGLVSNLTITGPDGKPQVYQGTGWLYTFKNDTGVVIKQGGPDGGDSA